MPELVDGVEMATEEDVLELGLPEKLQKRYLKLLKHGLTYVELKSLLEQNEITPVIVKYDLKANPELSPEALGQVIEDFRADARSDMRAREAALLFLKGLGLAARVAARGASLI